MFKENLPAVRLFLDSRTQMRVGFGGPVGLDYPGVESAARLSGIRITPPLFGKLQIIEHEYLNALAEKNGERENLSQARN